MTASIIVTLISANGLSQQDKDRAIHALEAAGGTISAETAFDPPYATDLIVSGISIKDARREVEAVTTACDIVCQPSGRNRRKKLLIADMDSTMIGQECIDELADFANLKPEIAAITEAAMRGELDFSQALEGRVAALKGLDASAIDACLAERITLTPGARTLVATMRAHGAKTYLVSGGFTAFTKVIADKIGFHEQHANVLHIENGKLTGTVGHPIVDSSTKREVLLTKSAKLDLPLDQTLAVGDGANDIPMIQKAGIGIAYHAKPAAAEAADAAIRVGDLTTLLWIQGIPRSEWTILTD